MSIAANQPLQSDRARSWPGRALAWWLGELRAPGDDLRRWLAISRRGAVTIEAGERYWILRQRQRPVGQIDWQAGDAETCRQALRERIAALRSARSIIVEIPPERVLSKTVSFPAAARARLDRIVEFEIARHFPFPAERVFFRHRVLSEAGGAGGAIAVEIVVVPRDVVAAICVELAACGWRPSGVAALSGGNADPLFLPTATFAPGARTASPARVVLLIGVALLGAAAAISWPLAQRQHLAAIEREIAALKPAAEAALRGREQHERAAERIAAVTRLRAVRPPLVAVLDRLSRDVPNDSWLLSLSVSGREIVLDGLSPSAATIALALERSRNFSGVVFRSPITRDAATGLEHFQLGATLAEARP